MNPQLKKLRSQGLPIHEFSDLQGPMSNLPEEYRQVLQLHFIQNVPRKEIAARLNCSLSKVNQKITRGITLLKFQLNPAYFEEMKKR